MNHDEEIAFIKKHFDNLKNTDADYCLIAKNTRYTKHIAIVSIPQERYWETIEEAIAWYFRNGWDTVKIYDLYAEFDTAMIRSVSKVTTVS
jgi:hypothetical protein